MSVLSLQKLEALLERVRRNRTAAPARSGALTATPRASTAPFAPVPTTPPTPKAPPVAASAPPARVEPPPYVAPSVRAEPPRAEAPRVEPPPYIEPPPPIEPPQRIEPPASVAPPEPPPPVTTPSWQPEPGSAVQARPTSMPPMEISDEDLLDVSTLPPEVDTEADAPQVEVAASEEEVETDEEQPPASSRRFKVPDSLDGGLTGAAQHESEREIPVKTPPPESGPQEALPATGLEAARMPDVSELEADLSGPPSMGPTAEQLGETIELEAPRGPELEIDVTVVTEEEAELPAPAEELEVSLPRPSLQSGLYDVAAAAPATVQAPPPEVREAVTMQARAAAEEGPERTMRPALGATDVAQVSLGAHPPAKTFVELLDASLGL